MRAKACAAIAAASVIAALLLPAGAAAGGPTSGRHRNPEVLETMRVWGTNGYGFEINLTNRHRLEVSASAKAGHGIYLTDYTLKAPQAPGSRDIAASLGKLGRIDVRFVRQSTKDVRPSHPVCDGEKTTIEYGRFVGRIEFRGEGGYTRLEKSRAVGAVTVEPPPSCRNQDKPHRRHPNHRPLSRAGTARLLAALGKKASESSEEKLHVLVLEAKADDPPVTFSSSQVIVPKKLAKKLNFGTFLATASRDRGRIQERISALDLLDSGVYFKVPDLTHPTRETVVTPPKPFLGSATFQRESADEVSWTGDLRVKLPGFGVVPLTGNGFEAVMCEDSGCQTHK